MYSADSSLTFFRFVFSPRSLDSFFFGVLLFFTYSTRCLFVFQSLLQSLFLVLSFFNYSTRCLFLRAEDRWTASR